MRPPKRRGRAASVRRRSRRRWLVSQPVTSDWFTEAQQLALPRFGASKLILTKERLTVCAPAGDSALKSLGVTGFTEGGETRLRMLNGWLKGTK